LQQLYDFPLTHFAINAFHAPNGALRLEAPKEENYLAPPKTIHPATGRGILFSSFPPMDCPKRDEGK